MSPWRKTLSRQESGRTYTTVSTVSTTTLLGCLIHLDVLDDQVAGVEALGVCV